jgi:DNA-binding PadR family transcriptional regulator
LTEHETLFDPEKIKQAKKRLKKEYKQQKRDLKEIEKASALLGEVLTRGFLTAYVLHLLSEGPLCGNEILREIIKRTEGRWEPSSGGIYPLLRKLEKQGFVSGEWEDPDKRTRRTYKLIQEGKTELDRLLVTLQPKAENTLQVFIIVVRDLFGRGDLSDAKTTAGSTVSSIKR